MKIDRVQAYPLRYPEPHDSGKLRYLTLVKLESDVEEPSKSPVFSKYPNFLNNHHAVNFVCDTLRMSISGWWSSPTAA